MDHKVFKVFDKEDFERLTKGIKVAQCMRTDTSTDTKDDADLLSKLDDLSVSEKLFCSFCNTAFEDQQQQRQHYKLDWHRYNLKKNLADKKPVSEENFSRLADQDDVSSISGSETESEEETDTDASTSDSVKTSGVKKMHPILASRHTKVFFENRDGDILSIYRCLLHSKKDVPEKDELFVPLALKTVTRTKWAIIMLGGGHFAAGIFDGREVVAHKTFHCYTVRKGQGGTQSSRDNRSGSSHPKSAGASLRRYNEAALTQHVQDITTAWAADLAACDLVFYRASGHNTGVLFGGRTPPLAKSDPRLRTVPFPTRRATFSEVKRVQEVLSSLEVYGPAEVFKSSFPQSPRKKIVKSTSVDLLTNASVETNGVKHEAVNESAQPESELNNSGSSTESPDSKKSRSPRQNIDRAKARKSPVRPLPDIVASLAVSSSESGDDLEVGDEGFHVSFISYEDVQMDFGESLQEYDDTVPQSMKNRKKTAKKGPKKKKTKENDGKAEKVRPEILALRRKLLTACRLGDVELLRCSLLPSPGDVPCVSDPVDSKVDGDISGGVLESDIPLEVPKEVVDDSRVRKSGVSSEDVLACLNDPVDDKENRVLHIAAQAGQVAIVRLLMEAGSDPSIKNKKGQPPYVSSIDKETRNAFRRFLAEFPDKYNYDKSQIPGGLTDDIEKEQGEKRRAMKKAKRDRIKEKKKEDELKKEEELERERFLKLTDREKRALAAERRLLTGAARGGGPKVIVSRCFLCATDISGKVPFEYDIHRFCSIVCLKSHRMMSKPQ